MISRASQIHPQHHNNGHIMTTKSAWCTKETVVQLEFILAQSGSWTEKYKGKTHLVNIALFLYVLSYLFQAESITTHLNNCFRQMVHLGCLKYRMNIVWILPIPSLSSFSPHTLYHPMPNPTQTPPPSLFVLWQCSPSFDLIKIRNYIISANHSYTNLAFCFIHHIFQTRYFLIKLRV